jgi:uncharacterized RDD family membrane protein YckC
MTAGGPPLPPPQAPGPWDGGQQYQPPPPPTYPVYQGYPTAAPYQNLYPGPAPGIGYAGFWIRVLAAIIDLLIFGIPYFVVIVVAEGTAIRSYFDCVNANAAAGTVGICVSPFVTTFGYFELGGFIVQFLYFVILWSQFGGTLGQRMLGLHVVDAATGKNIGIGRAIGRYVGYLISAFALYIGLIWVAFDSRKQGWHDKIASTFVVRKV